MQSKITKLTVAAAIIIAILVAINHFTGPIDGTTVAWADVVENVRQINTYSFQRTDFQTDVEKQQTEETKMTVYISSELGTRIDSYKNGKVSSSTYTLPEEKTIIVLMHSVKMYARNSLSEEYLKEIDQHDPREIVRRFISVDYENLPQCTINEKQAEGIEVHDPKVVSANFPIENLVARLWVDIETQLPVLLESEILANGGKIHIKSVLNRFDWNPELAPDTFDPVIPPDYKPMN